MQDRFIAHIIELQRQGHLIENYQICNLPNGQVELKLVLKDTNTNRIEVRNIQEINENNHYDNGYDQNKINRGRQAVNHIKNLIEHNERKFPFRMTDGGRGLSETNFNDKLYGSTRKISHSDARDINNAENEARKRHENRYQERTDSERDSE